LLNFTRPPKNNWNSSLKENLEKFPAAASNRLASGLIFHEKPLMALAFFAEKPNPKLQVTAEQKSNLEPK